MHKNDVEFYFPTNFFKSFTSCGFKRRYSPGRNPFKLTLPTDIRCNLFTGCPTLTNNF